MEYTLIDNQDHAIKLEGCAPIHIANRGPIFSVFDNMLIVTIKANLYFQYSDFVAIDENGLEIWKFNSTNRLEPKYPYKFPYLNKDGNLIIASTGGKEYLVDRQNGKIMGEKYKNMDFDYEIDVEHKTTKLKIGNQTHFLNGLVSNLYSYHGDILIIDFKQNDSLGKITNIYLRNGQKLDSFKGDTKIIDTDDGKYLVVFFGIESFSVDQFENGFFSIYENKFPPELILKNKTIPFLKESPTPFRYYGQSNCFVFIQDLYLYKYPSFQIDNYLLLRPEVMRFSFQNMPHTFANLPDDEINQKFTNLLLNCENFNWFPIAEFEAKYEEYSQITSLVKEIKYDANKYSLEEIQAFIKKCGYVASIDREKNQIKGKTVDIESAITNPLEAADKKLSAIGFLLEPDSQYYKSTLDLYRKFRKQFRVNKLSQMKGKIDKKKKWFGLFG